MKTTIAIFVALFMASANAAESSRKRTYAVHKSSADADEKFDPYLGVERKLAPYDWNPVKLPLLQHGSMSMSMSAAHSMSMSMTEPNG